MRWAGLDSPPRKLLVLLQFLAEELLAALRHQQHLRVPACAQAELTLCVCQLQANCKQLGYCKPGFCGDVSFGTFWAKAIADYARRPGRIYNKRQIHFIQAIDRFAAECVIRLL